MRIRIAMPWLLCALATVTLRADADPLRDVDPFIGTGGHGHTFPGPSMPFGMVQLGPDTRLEGWDGCSGYHFDDDRIFGFSHTHLSGTGVGDYCDILLLPGTGRVQWRSSWGRDAGMGYGSRFRKSTERASPGFYGVRLDDYGTTVELTVTPRAGMHRYTFPRGEDAWVLIDLAHRDEVLESSLRVVGDREVEGFRRSRGWATDQWVYFVARFSAPFAPVVAVDDSARAGARQATGRNVKAALQFSQAGTPLLVKVGISAVDIDGARRNLDAEIHDWDFDAVHEKARRTWREALARIDIAGADRARRTVFYTALYHTLLQPNLYTDADGRYRGRDGQVHHTDGWTQYTVFSLWDTFRAAHPLYTILEPARTADFVRTFLAQAREGGLLPVWELAGNETNCMIGYHAVSVIADAWAKGIRDFDATRALDAMIASAMQDGRGLAPYRELGYVPGDQESESVSKTLEYAYDDWCIAEMARALGRDADHATFLRRSQAWKNVFDPVTRLMRPKLGARFKTPFDPTEVDFHFTEANSWQYSFFVPHDVDGHIERMGGADAFVAQLDSLFGARPRTTGRDQADITGLIGQYAHGNEPSHHMAYLYSFAGQPWKTQARVRQILDSLYVASPDGLSGNEDCGQMSAWYVLGAMGFYSVTPGQDTYVIGTPLFDRATLRLPNGRRFTVSARGGSRTRPYIQSATLNGKPLLRSYLHHDEIAAGGELAFVLGPEPNRAWGSDAVARPPSRLRGEAITPVPYVASGQPTFRGHTEVTLASPQPDVPMSVSCTRATAACRARARRPTRHPSSSTRRARSDSRRYATAASRRRFSRALSGVSRATAASRSQRRRIAPTRPAAPMPSSTASAAATTSGSAPGRGSTASISRPSSISANRLRFGAWQSASCRTRTRGSSCRSLRASPCRRTESRGRPWARSRTASMRMRTVSSCKTWASTCGPSARLASCASTPAPRSSAPPGTRAPGIARSSSPTKS